MQRLLEQHRSERSLFSIAMQEQFPGRGHHGRPMTTLIAALTASVLIISGCAGSTADSASGDIVSGGDWDPQSLSPLGVSNTGSGAPVPVYSNSVVTDQQGLAVSVTPTLALSEKTKAPANQSYQFQVQTIGGQSSDVVWHAQVPENKVRVSQGVLQQGHVYLWQATNLKTNHVYGPYSMMVDTVRANKQPDSGVGPFDVSLASGQLSAGYSSRGVTSTSGTLGVNLSFSYGDEADPGLPAGWSIRGTGQTWDLLRELPGGAVELRAASGMTYAFTPTSGGAYLPVNPAGRLTPPSSLPTVAKNPDNSWTVTMASGAIYRFGQADSSGTAYLVESFNGTSTQPVDIRSNGRLDAVQDELTLQTGNPVQVSLQYQGSGQCPDVPEGFIAPGSGELCSITFPDGSSTDFHYLAAGSAPVLARVVDFPATRDGKAKVTDFGYDASGRITSVREPVAADVQAAGTRTDAQALLTVVSYDPVGRVASIIKPAATAGAPRPEYEYEYQQQAGETTVHDSGPATPTGFVTKYTYDVSTLLPHKTIDGAGAATSTTWDSSADLQLTASDQFGRTNSYTYDSQQRLQSEAGPYTGTDAKRAVQVQQYSYDQDLSGDEPVDMHGFNVTYWNNDTLSGTPSSRTYGPRFDDHVPAATEWNWPSSPTGGAPWSARLTGVVNTTVRSKNGIAPPYGFSVEAGANSARMWVDGVGCTPPSCQIPLAAGDHNIRIDLAFPQAQAGLRVLWQPPGAHGMTPIPMTAINPGYGLRSTITKRDALSADSQVNPMMLTDYSDPTSGKPTAAWVQGVQSRSTAEYESYDPSEGEFGRKTSDTLPAGNVIGYAYYGADDKVSIPCAGIGSYRQNGLMSSITRTTDSQPTAGGSSQVQVYSHYYDDLGRTIADSVNGSDAACTYYNDAGEVTQQTVPARGDEPAQSVRYYTNVNGDPLQAAAKTTVGDTEYVASVQTDLYGKPLKQVDIWGTTQVMTYDPLTGHVLTTVTTTKDGQQTTSADTYSATGELKTVTLDGKVVATLGRTTAAGRTVTYGNGVVETFANDSNGQFTQQIWQPASSGSGKKSSTGLFEYSTDMAPTSRVLTEHLWFGSHSPAQSAKFDYSYDDLGRLSSADLTTGLPVAHKQWQYRFAAPSLGTSQNAGLNSNRTSKTVDGVTTQYGYNTSDQLIDTSDPAIGNRISYSGWGEITNLGDLTIDYDSASLVTQIVDGQSGDRIQYRRVAGTTVEKTQTRDGRSVVSRYTLGGFVMNDQNVPQWQVVDLPGGTTLIRDLSGSQQWQHSTNRGQLMWVSDANGQDTGQRHLYSPYGEELVTDPAASSPQPTPASDQTGSVPPPDYQWQAGSGLESETVGTTAVVDMGARLYIPTLGRFTSPDPAGHASANAYDYVNQDPINFTDTGGSAPSWFKTTFGEIVVAALTTVAGIIVASVATEVLAAAGVTAAAESVPLQQAYLVSQVLLGAGVGLASDATQNEAEYGTATPGGFIGWYKSIEEVALATVSMSVAGYMARANLLMYAARRAASGAASDAAAAMRVNVTVPIVDAVRGAQTQLSATTTAVTQYGAQVADSAATVARSVTSVANAVITNPVGVAVRPAASWALRSAGTAVWRWGAGWVRWGADSVTGGVTGWIGLPLP